MSLSFCHFVTNKHFLILNDRDLYYCNSLLKLLYYILYYNIIYNNFNEFLSYIVFSSNFPYS